MIKVQSLSHRYNNGPILNFPDWTIEDNEQWLLIGSSGSGKSTLLNCISGLLKPVQGNVVINETDLYSLSSKAMDKFRGQHIGIVFQKPHLIQSLTISENIEIACSFAGLSADKSKIFSLLDSLGLGGKAKKHPNELSQGQLQRVSVARALINKPTLLIADEPTSSLDDKNAELVIEMLITQAKESGASLVIATHDTRIRTHIEKEYLL